MGRDNNSGGIMKSPLEQVNSIDELISQMQKIDSRMMVGHFIDAWRDVKRIIAALEKAKSDIIQEEKNRVAK